MSAGRLAELLHLDPSTLTGVLRRLVERGLVDRRSDPRDGRRVRLGLTARGRDLDVVVEGTIESAVGEALAAMAPARVSTARTVLRVLAESLNGVGVVEKAKKSRVR